MKNDTTVLPSNNKKETSFNTYTKSKRGHPSILPED